MWIPTEASPECSNDTHQATLSLDYHQSRGRPKLPVECEAECYHSSVDTIAAQLRRDGWNMGHVAVEYAVDCAWVVTGRRDGPWIEAEGRTKIEVWRRSAAVVYRNTQR
jgi:hypothetical protein